MKAQVLRIAAITLTKIVWPANTVVAKAYIDQLNRTKAIPPAEAKAVTDALTKADKIHSSKDKSAAAVAKELDGLAAQLEGSASSRSGQDAAASIYWLAW